MAKIITLLLALVWVAADYLTKQWALKTLSHQIIQVNEYMNFHLAFNPGAAFSFMANFGGFQRWVLVGLTIIICLWIVNAILRNALSSLELFAYGSILGGAIGNLFDRLNWLDGQSFAKSIGHIDNPYPGYVIDFIQWHYQNSFYWPTFNIADVAITIGVGVLVLHWIISLFSVAYIK